MAGARPLSETDAPSLKISFETYLKGELGYSSLEEAEQAQKGNKSRNNV